MGGNTIWSMSETHLSAQGIARFQQALKLRKCGLQFHPGAPAPLRSQTATSIGGTHTGTGFITSLPSRRLQATWPDEVWQEGRFAMNTFYINGTWIHGAVCYCYAHKSENTATRQQTERLLSHAVYRILKTMKGKRFLAGDWNQQIGDINTFQELKDHGWQEIQLMALEKHGREVTKTCHNTSTKDFVWISPELQPHWQRTDAASLFPDHHHLWAEFANIGVEEPVHLWRQPKPIQWDCEPNKLHLPSEQRKPPVELNTQDTLATLAEEFEQRTAKAMKQHNHTMPTCQKGRSKTVEVKKVRPHEVPNKPSRQGHAKPDFHGQNKRHAEWFKQLRRLESITQGGPNTQAACTHKEKEWRKILAAQGFGTSFAVWWRQLDSYLDFAPARLPTKLPTPEELQAIRLTFEKEFRNMEQALIQNCITTAKRNRKENPNKVFQDIRPPPAAPVALVEQSSSARIVEVDYDECAVVLDHAMPYDPALPLFTCEQVLLPIHVDSDKLWLQSVADLAPGQVVRQEQFEGSLEKLFGLFQEEWMRRWDRHRDVPTSEWDPLINFFVNHFPRGDLMPPTPITPEEWMQSLRNKKSRAATGPDGWARKDLLSMPLDLVQQMLHLLARIEQGEDWPITVVTGLICSLAKVDNPKSVQQYRPITIFSLIYRNWSSIRAKRALVHLERYAPSRCYGNMPRRAASQVWLGIQAEPESANTFGTRISGATIDIQKCFNHMPRLPIFAVCEHVGICTSTLRAWANALQNMSRRFVVRGSVSSPNRSTTGCAEGCALSVLGMAALNVLIDCWMTVRVPQAALWSYVDNLELSSPNAHVTMEGLTQLRKVLAGLDLLVDENKTILWANHAADRKILKDHNYRVVHWARDLGGHVQYTKVPTNRTIVEKIKKFQPRWRNLARSPAPKSQKTKAIKMAAWPNALHAISSVTLRDELVKSLRTQAMRSLGLEQLGASPIIQLGMLEGPMTDPGYYALQRTVLDARYYLAPTESKQVLTHLAIPTGKLVPEVGPCSVLLHRLNQIGWHWEPDTFVDQHGMTCDLWECPVQELSWRIMDAWQTKCLNQLTQRQTFRNMHRMSVTLTVRKLPHSPCERGIMHRSLNGTFFTADHGKHMGSPDDEVPHATTCQFCGAPDSQHHRHWTCPEFAVERARCPPDIAEAMQDSTSATANHGWIPEPKLLRPFHRALHELPDTTGWHSAPQDLQPVLDVFTDGSCRNPTDSITRLASWGAVLHTPEASQEFTAISGGMVPGLIQTVARAEYMAAISAIQFCFKHHKPFRIWVDNSQVYKTLLRASRCPGGEPYQVTNRVKNHDLINDLGCLMYQARSLCERVIKVYSHQCHGANEPWLTKWSWRGNEAADNVASSAISEHPDLLDLWTELCNQVTALERLREHVHATLTAVGYQAQQKVEAMKKQAREPDEPAEPVAREYQPWNIVAEPRSAALQCADTAVLHEWCSSLHQPDQPVRWWTWQMLFIDARLQFPDHDLGPWYDTKRRQWREGAVCSTRVFPKRTRWFVSYVTQCAKDQGFELPIQLSRPSSTAYAFWIKTLPVRTTAARAAAIDEWLSEWGTLRQHKDHRRIDKLP
eukprot:Skav209258  [mRNA]  locus=scaffold990:390937:395688:- [translate_table: standard]